MNALHSSSLAAEAKRALGDGFRGRCIGSDDADIILANKQHAAALPLHLPEVLIRCRTGGDVVRAFEFVRNKGVSFSIRSGGHCFADLSNRGDAIIDCSELNGFEVESHNSVVVGPGILSGDAIANLLQTGLTLPVGGCPLVALGGMSLVGGFGLTGRWNGVLSDRVRTAEILLADGDLVECDSDQYSDLLWAITGAGPLGFGIVTQIRLDAVPSYPGVAIAGAWPIAQAPEIFALWQNYAPLANHRASLQISLMAPEDPNEPCYVRCYGAILDTGDFGEDALEPLLASMARHFGPFAKHINVRPKSANDMALYACGAKTYQGEPAWLPSRPYAGAALLAQRSQFFDEPLPDNNIAYLIERLQAGRTMMQLREIECIPWRGGYAQGNDRSCFSHRRAYMLLRYNSLTGQRPTQAIRVSMQDWVDDCQKILSSCANSRVYAGYAEQDLPNSMAAYFGSAAPRLAALKQHYDPHNVFMTSVGEVQLDPFHRHKH
jgi:FAD binding domain/Berberine and berberine like